MLIVENGVLATFPDICKDFLAYFPKIKSRLIKSPVCLSVCPSFLKRLVDFHEIWQGGNAIQGDLAAITSNPITSTILKWLRLKFHIFSLAHQWFRTGSQGMYFTIGGEVK
jgi:hypothetical protein